MTATMEQRSPAESTKLASLPARLRALADSRPGDIALREKEFGIWQETTYQEFWHEVQAAGMALWQLGVRPGDKVAIHSENRKAWVIADLAAQAIQAVSVGLYATNPTAEVAYLLQHSEAKVLIAEDQEQVDKALEVESLPDLEKIIYVEPRGVRAYTDARLMSWSAFMGAGESALADDPHRVNGLVDTIDPEETATLVYTSGTTGAPKGAMLSHRNLTWASESAEDLIAAGGLPKGQPQLLSYLPLCHVFGRLYDVCGALAMGSCVNFAESIETVVADLAEIQPTYFPAPPRIWEKMHALVNIRMSDASLLKKAMYKVFLNTGMKSADRLLATGSRGFVGGIVHQIGYLAVFRSLQRKLGMQRCKQATSGAAPIAPEVIKFFLAIGIPLYEGWGMTETTALGTGNLPGSARLGTIGTPVNGDVQIRLGDDGEILIKSPGIFKGYFKNPEATAETIDEDGWMHTGDIAEYDDEFLRIVDRKKDIIITAGGKNVSPSEIENKLKVSPFIKEAMVIGDRRKYLTALIGIELDTVSNWAQRKGITFTTYRDLSEKPEVIELIQKQVDTANEYFARVETVKKFALIPKELDHEEGELTATQKLKRKVLVDRFSDLIEQMY
ncbi:MAG: AMP-binding protein [Acidimicrobiia bacterium]|nr:AMP-binding protein [Acidimicrobiia bacterium]MDH5502918.1 AMP-binding protein [Acidimicrobiia bacterium]